MYEIFDSITTDSVLPPEALRAVAEFVLSITSADMGTVRVTHVAAGTARVSRNRVRVNSNGDTITLDFSLLHGNRLGAGIELNQLDEKTLRQAVAYIDRIAHEQVGDATPTTMPVAPRIYGPNTSWKPATAEAIGDARAAVLPNLVRPLLRNHLNVGAFVGVSLRSTVLASTQGVMVAAQESDTEMTVTGWNANGKGTGWAGQAARDWMTLNPAAVADEAARLTRLAANPVAFEPGRRVVILDRPAVAQIVRTMGYAFDAYSTFILRCTPMYSKVTHQPRLHEQVLDSRISLSSDPNDPDGEYFPFNDSGEPLVAMPWIERGVLTHLAYGAAFAAQCGVTPSNDAPESLRMSGGSDTIEDMIAHCKEAIYVNRFAQVSHTGDDPTSGMLTGITSGACLLIRNGKIEKSIRPLRFVASPWFFLNQLEAIGSSQRTAFGYAPWAGNSWPIAPTIVPPLMIREFNFTAMADAI